MAKIIYGGQVITNADSSISADMLAAILQKINSGETFWMDIHGDDGPLRLLLGPGIPFGIKAEPGDKRSLIVSDSDLDNL